MYRDERIAGSWEQLSTRLERTGALARWARKEPGLQGLDSADDAHAAVALGGDLDRCDEILGALVRTAAADGGDDCDAVLLLLHLLSPGVAAMAAKYSDLCPDVMAVIVGELAATIRAFPWRRRHRAMAANLLLDTRAAVLRELCPRHARGSRAGEDIPVDPSDALMANRHGEPMWAEHDRSPDLDLRHLLTWAQNEGVSTPEDLNLLLELESYRRPAASPRLLAAAAHGVSERTVRRRRDHTLNALRQARNRYLMDAA